MPFVLILPVCAFQYLIHMTFHSTVIRREKYVRDEHKVTKLKTKKATKVVFTIT